MPFKTRDTQIQSFQFRIIHRTTTCNEWLNNLTIKTTNKCNFYEHTDSIIPFFILTVKKKKEDYMPSGGKG